MKKIYLDSCVIIYLIEGKAPFYTAVSEQFKQSVIQGDLFYTTDLVRLECRTHPIKQQKLDILIDFDDFFSQAINHCFDLKRPVFDLATQLRANHSLKTPDALHLAAAIHYGCHEFWTNDQRLQKAASNHLQVINLFAPQGAS